MNTDKHTPRDLYCHDGAILAAHPLHGSQQITLMVKQGCSDEEVDANAARIVASWNATLGLSTAALESGVIAEMVQALERARYEINALIEGGRKVTLANDALVVIHNVLAKAKSQ